MATWDPLDPGITVERHAERVLVSHPAYPYLGEWDDATGAEGLCDIAVAYLDRLENPSSHQPPRIGMPAYWLADLKGQSTGHAERPYLFWLGMNPSGDFDYERGHDPRNSFWLERRRPATNPAQHPLVERTAILLATLFESRDRKFPYMGGQGIRIVAHVALGKISGKYPMRITGLTSTLPRGFEKRSAAFTITRDEIKDLAKALLKTFALPEHQVAEFGVHIKSTDDVTGNTTRPDAVILAKAMPQKGAERDKYSYALAARWVRPALLLPLSKRTLVSGVSAKSDVFEQDPLTKLGAAAFGPMSPHRPLAMLDAQRVQRTLVNLQPTGTAGMYPLEDADVVVTNSRFCDVRGGIQSGDAPLEIAAVVSVPTRTNLSAAINAYYHARQFYDLLAAYGISAGAYFKFVPRKLWVRYRSGITPGPGKDGNVINAQVSMTPRPLAFSPGEFLAQNVDKNAARIEERLALADLRISPRRWPLGLACYPRSHWHEVSHILVAAAIGELELRFAHSGGDAISAIYFDPGSQLATDKNWRGVTFPWLEVAMRRHDRPVGQGWGWSGSLYQRDRFYVSPGLCDKRTYWTEQILSSSLFRLYCAIGGDSVDAKALPDQAARQAAADHALFLIIQAIALLGPAAVTPAYTAEDFVAALIGVDVGTSTFGGRVGGMVRKVIRWAFQQQGLYQAAGTTLPANCPGALEKIDLHIDSQRNVAVEGIYAPMPFPSTLWHASPTAMWNRKNDDANGTNEPAHAGRENHLRLTARNLGSQTANGVDAMLYWVRMADATSIPPFDSTRWHASQKVTHQVAAGNQHVFKLKWKPPVPGHYAVLAMVSNADDRSNIDPASGLPCAQAGAVLPTAQLVAWDNNLGLRIIQAV